MGGGCATRARLRTWWGTIGTVGIPESEPIMWYGHFIGGIESPPNLLLLCLVM
jgi:hypothetical protein